MPPLRGAALRRDRAGARLEPRGGDQDGGGRRRPRRPDHPAGHNAEARGWTGAGVDRGLLQRRGSGEAGVRREHDRVGGGGRERGAHGAVRRGGAGLHRRTDRRRAVRPSGRRSRCSGSTGRSEYSSARRRSPTDSAARTQIDQIIDFTEFAQQNVGLSDDVLASVGQPIRVDTTVVEGGTTPLSTFAVAIAVSVSLMFVTILRRPARSRWSARRTRSAAW